MSGYAHEPQHHFEPIYKGLLRHVERGEHISQPPHQMKDLGPEWDTREQCNITLYFEIPFLVSELRREVQPNLPWADLHFSERVCGEPLNPPPSHEVWPFARAGNKEHMEGGKFSHTYPERFWPKHAGDSMLGVEGFECARDEHWGIRFQYGDYSDLIQLLWEEPLTRQAYLPIWFPEDLTAAREGQRVPCSLGYHFLMRGNELNMTYSIRSCDLIRYFRDDFYMACRLVQHTLQCLRIKFQMKKAGEHGFPWTLVQPGVLTMHIGSLHAFEGDFANASKTTT